MQAVKLTCVCLSLLALTHVLSAHPSGDRRDNAIRGNTVRLIEDISRLLRDLGRYRRLAPMDDWNEESEEAVDDDRRSKRYIGLFLKDHPFNHRQYHRGRARPIHHDPQQPRSNIVPI